MLNTLVEIRLEIFPIWRGLLDFPKEAGIVAAIAALLVALYTKFRPPGIAFTYCWLWVLLLAWFSQSTDSLAFAFALGFGLNVSWYTTQFVHLDLWPSLLPYWHELFPWGRIVETCVRVGDLIIHPLPLMLLTQYHKHVTTRHAVYAFLYERWWFRNVEGDVFGNGGLANVIYDMRPPGQLELYRTSQLFSMIGYFFAAASAEPDVAMRYTKLTFWAAGFLYVFLSRGDPVQSRLNALLASLHSAWIGDVKSAVASLHHGSVVLMEAQKFTEASSRVRHTAYLALSSIPGFSPFAGLISSVSIATLSNFNALPFPLWLPALHTLSPKQSPKISGLLCEKLLDFQRGLTTRTSGGPVRCLSGATTYIYQQLGFRWGSLDLDQDSCLDQLPPSFNKRSWMCHHEKFVRQHVPKASGAGEFDCSEGLLVSSNS